MSTEDTAEAMRRLGGPVERCPTCGSWFATNRRPRHWILIYIDGEPVDIESASLQNGYGFLRADIGLDLFCSKPCADERVAVRQRTVPWRDVAGIVQYVYWEERYRCPSGVHQDPD